MPRSPAVRAAYETRRYPTRAPSWRGRGPRSGSPRRRPSLSATSPAILPGGRGCFLDDLGAHGRSRCAGSAQWQNARVRLGVTTWSSHGSPRCPSMHFSANRGAAAQQRDRLEQVAGDHRQHTFSSKLPCVPGERDGGVVADHLGGDLSTTSGITGFTLPGMIDEPGWSAGRGSSASPARGPRSHQHEVLRDLGQRHRETLQCPVQLHQAVADACASKRVEGSRAERRRRSRTVAANSG